MAAGTGGTIRSGGRHYAVRFGPALVAFASSAGPRRQPRDGSSPSVVLPAPSRPSGVIVGDDIYIDDSPSPAAFADATRRPMGAEFIAAMTGEGA